jgi:hypothetical protein
MMVEFKLLPAIIRASQYFEHDLNLRDRLDARIARLVKHLVQTKAMKQIIRQTSTEGQDNLRKIPGK